MLRKMGRQGQSTIEYAILISIVVAALLAMNIYVRRAVEANIQVIQERLNDSPQ